MAKTEHFVFSIFMKIDMRNFVVMTNMTFKNDNLHLIVNSRCHFVSIFPYIKKTSHFSTKANFYELFLLLPVGYCLFFGSSFHPCLFFFSLFSLPPSLLPDSITTADINFLKSITLLFLKKSQPLMRFSWYTRNYNGNGRRGIQTQVLKVSRGQVEWMDSEKTNKFFDTAFNVSGNLYDNDIYIYYKKFMYQIN